MSARVLKSGALAAVCLVSLALGAGCSGAKPDAVTDSGAPDAPIGLMKSATDGLVVFIGNQCADAQYPTRVTVNNYDQGSRTEQDPAVWDVSTSKPDLLPSLVIGKLPYGFNEVSNHIAEQGLGAVLRVQVVANGAQAAVFDTGKLSDGQFVDARGSITTVNDFRGKWGCGAK
jgi:hypothetical protein